LHRRKKLYVDQNSLAAGTPGDQSPRGWRTKQWVTRKGVTLGGNLFTKGASSVC
jgi:hypothetical protein